MGLSYEEALVEQGLCPELVMIRTEDGMVDGRCKAPTEGGYMCAVHAEEMRMWRSMSEAQKAEWERCHDRDNP